jgi:hypothetical protein
VKITKKRLGAARWLIGHGIEIRALDNPQTVPDGSAVTYVDRLSADVLHQRHPNLANASLVPVDIIAEAEDLSPIQTVPRTSSSPAACWSIWRTLCVGSPR